MVICRITMVTQCFVILFRCIEVPSLECSMAGSYQVALWCTAFILSIPKVASISRIQGLPLSGWQFRVVSGTELG